MLRQKIKNALPPVVVRTYQRIRLNQSRRKNEKQSAAQVFSEIYAKNLWGGAKGEYYSGSGSAEQFTRPYCDFITTFVRQDLRKPVTILDLGCGDFRVGKTLVSQLQDCRYVGVDIVPDLIRRNIELFADARTYFTCLDIIEHELPDADICLVRQVLQHLSNAEICAILRKLHKYRYVFVTEHYPSSDKGVANKDKPHGPDVRLYDNSAVYLDKPPFNVCNLDLCLTVLQPDSTALRTYKITHSREAGCRTHGVEAG